MVWKYHLTSPTITNMWICGYDMQYKRNLLDFGNIKCTVVTVATYNPCKSVTMRRQYVAIYHGDTSSWWDLNKPKAKACGISRKDTGIFGVGQGLWWRNFKLIRLTMVQPNRWLKFTEERLAARSLIQRYLERVLQQLSRATDTHWNTIRSAFVYKIVFLALWLLFLLGKSVETGTGEYHRIPLVYPPCSNSHHQDHYIFSRESL